MSRTSWSTLAIVTTAVAGLLAGCGSGASSPPPAAASGTAPSPVAPPSGPHNQADIEFATGMIPHHAQAVSMSNLATDRAGSPRVKELAGRIEGAQQPEIDLMSGWLRSWNAPVPSAGSPADTGGMSGMDHGGGAMPGMMSADQMSGLEQARGADFDKRFLQLMISHHEGAVAMSRTELSDGQNADAKALAQRIISAQQAEIGEMRSLLATG